jgi:hypothetical protein
MNGFLEPIEDRMPVCDDGSGKLIAYGVEETGIAMPR